MNLDFGILVNWNKEAFDDNVLVVEVQVLEKIVQPIIPTINTAGYSLSALPTMITNTNE